MSVRHALLGLSLGVLFVSATWAADTGKEIRRWVAQLGSPRYTEREAAARQLQVAGREALTQLTAAGRDAADAEIRLRARVLVRKIQRHLEEERILAAQPLRLVYRDMPVLEAVEDFSSKSGVPLQVDGDRTGLAGRRITLDTGETTFWAALEQFCREAGLAEKGFAAATPTAGPAPPPRHEERAPVLPRPASPYRVSFALQLLLVDAKPRSIPVHRAGAVRIRALPPERSDVAPGGVEDLTLGFDVTTEPKLPILAVTGLTITRAVDERGQNLRQRWPDGPGGLPADEREVQVMRASSPGAVRWAVPARLAPGKQPSTVLKELHGKVTVCVRALRPLIRVDEVLGRAGETVRGEEGGALQILNARREEGGKVRLRLQVDTSAVPLTTGQVAPAVRVRPGLVALRGVKDDADRFALVDDAGRPWQRSEARRTFQDRPNGTIVVEYELLYQPAAGQHGPAHLVYSTTRPVIIDIPFRLRDVPLR